MKTSFLDANHDMCVCVPPPIATHTHTHRHIVPEYCLETYETVKDMILLEKFLSTPFLMPLDPNIFNSPSLW